MATELANWIRESTATTGTGTITLGGAETGFVSFEDHPDISSGDTVHYYIEDGNNKEYGIGTLTSGASWTLARTTVKETLVSGTFDNTSPTAISLSGSALVGIAPVKDAIASPGSDYVFHAWASFDGTAGTISLADSLNVSSITDNGTGRYVVNFTTALPSANYVVTGWAGSDVARAAGQGRFLSKWGVSADPTTTACAIDCFYTTSASADADFVCVAFLGG